MNWLGVFSALLFASVVLFGCADDALKEGCKSNTNCPQGQYCGPNGSCNYDCRSDVDCAAGNRCNSFGICVTTSLNDGGPADSAPSKPDSTSPVKEGGAKPDKSYWPGKEGGVKLDGGYWPGKEGGVKLDGGYWPWPEGGVKLDGGYWPGKDGGVILDGGYWPGKEGGVKLDGGYWPWPEGGTSLDGGVPAGGFGSRCYAGSSCGSGLVCAVTQPGAPVGFCTKQCNPPASPCTGAPSGTEAYCILSDAKGKYFCVFLCKYKKSGGTKTVPCPPQLLCNSMARPPGSGQHACVP